MNDSNIFQCIINRSKKCIICSQHQYYLLTNLWSKKLKSQPAKKLFGKIFNKISYIKKTPLPVSRRDHITFYVQKKHLHLDCPTTVHVNLLTLQSFALSHSSFLQSLVKYPLKHRPHVQSSPLAYRLNFPKIVAPNCYILSPESACRYDVICTGIMYHILIKALRFHSNCNSTALHGTFAWKTPRKSHIWITES